MANKKITELPEKLSVEAGDLLIIEDTQTSTTMKIDANLLKGTSEGDGEPYVEILSDEALPVITSGDGIAIGPETQVANYTSMAIGSYAVVQGTAQPDSEEDPTPGNNVAIGNFSQVNNSYYGLALGSAKTGNVDNNGAIADGPIAIGQSAHAKEGKTIAIGTAAESAGSSAIAMGWRSDANGFGAISLGYDSEALNTSAIGIGYTAHAQGLNAISIGRITDSHAENSIAIGNRCKIEAGGNASIVIGNSIDLEGGESGDPPGMILIGDQVTTASGATNSIGIGTRAHAENVDTIAIGTDSRADAATAIAIGEEAHADVGGSIQLGKGTNSTQSTLQLFNNTLANAEGLYTSFTNPANYTPIDDDNVTSHFEAIDTALGNVGGGGGEPYVEINSTGTLPDIQGTDSICIGSETLTVDDNSIALGHNAQCQSNQDTVGSFGGIAIGYDSQVGDVANELSGDVAVAIGGRSKALEGSTVALGFRAESTANQAIQLGQGTNNNPTTLQFRNITIANAQGLQAPVATGNNLQSPPAGTMYVDDTSGSERICVYLNGSWKCANLI